jgi:hypothetical protein
MTMKRLLLSICFLLVVFGVRGQGVEVTTTAGEELVLSYERMQSIYKVNATQTAILYDLSYTNYLITTPFESFVSNAGCNLIDFTDEKTGRKTAVPLVNIDRITKRVDTTGIIFAELVGGRRDIPWTFTEHYDSIRVDVEACSVSGASLSPTLGIVFTDESVTGDGSSPTPVVLVNDEDVPGDSHYYGTDTSGVKGWYPIDSTGYTENTEAANLEDGIGIFSYESGDSLYLRSLYGSGQTTVTEEGDSIIISSEDATTAVNLGAFGPFKEESGDSLYFRTIAAGLGISLSLSGDGDTIFIAATGSGGADIEYVQSGDFQAFYTGASPPTYSLVSNTATISVPSGTDLISCQINESFTSIGATETMFIEVVDVGGNLYGGINTTWIHNIQVVERDLLSGTLPNGAGQTFRHEAGDMALAQRTTIEVWEVDTGTNTVTYRLTGLGTSTNFSILIR